MAEHWQLKPEVSCEKGRQPPGVEPRTLLAWAASAQPLSHNSRTTTNPHNICTAQVVLNAPVAHLAAPRVWLFALNVRQVLHLSLNKDLCCSLIGANYATETIVGQSSFSQPKWCAKCFALCLLLSYCIVMYVATLLLSCFNISFLCPAFFWGGCPLLAYLCCSMPITLLTSLCTCWRDLDHIAKLPSIIHDWCN